MVWRPVLRGQRARVFHMPAGYRAGVQLGPTWALGELQEGRSSQQNKGFKKSKPLSQVPKQQIRFRTGNNTQVLTY